MNGEEFLGRPLHPWLPDIGYFLEKVHAVDVSASELVVIWDSRDAHGFKVDGFIITSQAEVDSWMHRQMVVRQKHQLGSSVVQYKNLNDGRKWRALPDVLNAAEKLRGTCLVSLIDDRYDALRLHEARMVLEESEFGKSLQHSWKDSEFLRIQRIVIMLVWIIKKVARGGQAIRWLCDEDNMWGSPAQKADMEKLLRVMSAQALLHKSTEMTYAHYKSGGYHNLIAEELVAIVDLAVGGVSDAYGLVQQQGYGRTIVFPEPKRGRAHSKVEVLADWYWSTRQTPLRRMAVEVEDGCSGLITTRMF